jgi:outer membrane protein assembly factor BamB
MDRSLRFTGAMLATLTALLALPALACAASAWPMFGHDAAHSRRTTVTGAQTATLKWSADLTLANGWIYSSPALAADGTVYITAEDFTSEYAHLQLYALNPSNGAVKWHADAGDAHGSSPGVAPDGTIYVGGNLLSAPLSQRGKVFAFGPDGGAPLWTFSTWSTFYSSPAIDADGNVYIGCDDGNVYSLSPLGDHLNWGAQIDSTWGVDSSPAVDEDALFVGGIGDLVSLRTISPGTQRWAMPTQDSAAAAEAAPAISNDGETVYFADEDGVVYARAASGGEVVWTHSGLGSVPPSKCTSSPGVGSDGTIYVGGYDGSVYALKALDGSVKWKYATGGPVQSSPAIGSDGTVYIGSDDGRVYALDGSTGALKWSYLTGGGVSSSPAIGADATVYVGSEDGKLYAFGGGSAPVACKLSTPRTSGALKRTVAVKYSGTLTPARAAKVTLTFQRKKGSAWKAFSTVKVSTTSAGAWSYKKKLAAATYRLRAATAATGAYKAATSGWKTVVIK